MNPMLRLAGWLIAVALVALPVVAVLRGWIGADRWALTHLRATGRFEHVDPRLVQRALLPHAKRGYFAVDLQAAQAAVARLPWVDQAQVRKRWPDVLEVTITEHRPFARWGRDRLLSDRGAGRLDIWTAGLFGLRTNWVLGYGIGGFAKQALGLIQRATGASLDVARQEDFKATNTIPAHNIYLQAVLDLGVVGGILYFGTLLVAMKNLWDMLKTEWHDVAWIGLGCLTAFLAMGPFASQLNPKMPWAMVGLPGAYFVRRALTDRQDRRATRLTGVHTDVDR